MSRFRYIVAALILGVGLLLSGLWSDPPLPPEPPHEVTRGLAVTPGQVYYEEWLNAAKAKQAGLVGSAVTVETDTFVLIGSIVGLTTGVLALLARYVIAPMIAKQIKETMSEIDAKYVRKDRLEEHLRLDEERHDVIIQQLGQIWERVK